MALLMRLAKAGRVISLSRSTPSQGIPRHVVAFSSSSGDESAPVDPKIGAKESPAATGPNIGGDYPTGAIGPIGSDGLPTYVDWVKFGAVTPLQNQGDCGSCFSFSAAASLEGLHFIETGQLFKLSEQHIIDGSHLRNRGCEGGTAYEALLYIKRNGGIVFSEHYPYIGKQCVPKKLTAPGLMIDDAADYTSISEHVLKWRVAQQPVCATIGADAEFYEDVEDGVRVLEGPNFSLSEIYDRKIAHSIAVVGYGAVDPGGRQVWLAKCSNGNFLLIARGSGALGINRRVSFPIRLSCTREIINVTVKSDEELGVEPLTNLYPY
ncbi:hypothetical protein ACQJBY_038119 [Aegilops geniculata]